MRSTPTTPMRVIAKKRCRAMFEPPEKGERATLNPNLSTRLLLFSDQALGRRVGYCWSRRASVRRFIFNAKTLKLCARSSSHPSPTNRAVSIRCRMFSVMSELGQSRPNWAARVMSGLPPFCGHLRRPGWCQQRKSPTLNQSPVCTENPIQVYRMIESAKLAR